jgi:hypothetical protein
MPLCMTWGCRDVFENYAACVGMISSGRNSLPYGTYIAGHSHAGVAEQDWMATQELDDDQLAWCEKNEVKMRILCGGELARLVGLQEEKVTALDGLLARQGGAEQSRVHGAVAQSVAQPMVKDCLRGVLGATHLGRVSCGVVTKQQRWPVKVEHLAVDSLNGVQVPVVTWPTLQRQKWDDAQPRALGVMYEQGVTVETSNVAMAGKGLFVQRVFAPGDIITEYAGDKCECVHLFAMGKMV